nr:hypothetical protein [Candidatus Gracilibacteria bacterium]
MNKASNNVEVNEKIELYYFIIAFKNYINGYRFEPIGGYSKKEIVEYLRNLIKIEMGGSIYGEINKLLDFLSNQEIKKLIKDYIDSNPYIYQGIHSNEISRIIPKLLDELKIKLEKEGVKNRVSRNLEQELQFFN